MAILSDRIVKAIWMEADLKPQTMFLDAVFAPIGLVTGPRVVGVSLDGKHVNVEKQRRERDR